jgi:TonB family protein
VSSESQRLLIALLIAAAIHALLLVRWPWSAHTSAPPPAVELRLLTKDSVLTEGGLGDLTAEQRYIEHWRRTMEGYGTANFPAAALPMPLRTAPVVELAVRADGSLAELRLIRGSGQPQLDRIAVEMLRAAAPFAPFPAELAARRASLRFAYEWRFETGETGF